MKFPQVLSLGLLTAVTFAVAPNGRAGDQSMLTQGAPTTTTITGTSATRYGFLNLLDHRSVYGQGAFPEPFLTDDSDGETNEFRADWLHTKTGASHSDSGKVEVEKGFGVLTLEVEVPYERNVSPDGIEKGFDNVDVGARVPVVQYVSPGGNFDTTFGVGIEIGIPTTSPVSKNAEFVPKIFNDTRFGKYLTLQSIFGYSVLTGPGDDGGLRVFEYGFMAGITLDHKTLPIPGVEQLIPFFELSGEKQLNHDEKGTNSILGNVGIRVNLKAWGPLQPRLGIGWVTPLNQAAREDVHAGVFTSLVFEY